MSTELKTEIEKTAKRAANLNSPRLYVRHWLARNDIEVTGGGNIKKDGRDFSLKSLTTTMWLDYKQEVAAQAVTNSQLPKGSPFKIKVFEIKETDLKKALEELISLETEKAKAECALAIRATTPAIGLESPPALPILEKYVQAIRGAAPQLDVMVLAHWLWCVKRKALGMPVAYHIMPVFYGKQKGGKSEAIKALCRPLKDFMQQLGLDNLGDERYNLALAKSLIVFFDEMEGAERADVQKLKRQITTDFNSTRLFHTQDVVKTEQACMFIGASNKHINELIIDSTGMRRFFQIECLDVLDWNSINEINYLELWRSINEHREKGYTHEVETELTASQVELTPKEDVELFAEAVGVNLSSGVLDDFELTDIYYTYKLWALRSGIKPLSLIWFGRKFCNKIKCEKVRKWEDGKLITYYKINAKAAIKEDKQSAAQILEQKGV